MQTLSKRWDQYAEEKPPLTLNFIVSVARELEVLKVLSLTELFGVRVKMEMYLSPYSPL